MNGKADERPDGKAERPDDARSSPNPNPDDLLSQIKAAVEPLVPRFSRSWCWPLVHAWARWEVFAFYPTGKLNALADGSNGAPSGTTVKGFAMFQRRICERCAVIQMRCTEAEVS